jgi:hypothetical protein
LPVKNLEKLKEDISREVVVNELKAKIRARHNEVTVSTSN